MHHLVIILSQNRGITRSYHAKIDHLLTIHTGSTFFSASKRMQDRDTQIVGPAALNSPEKFLRLD